jgi:hypothetical protein
MSTRRNHTTRILLSGSLVLSTGRSVTIRLEMETAGEVTCDEEREIKNATIAVHDLSPRVTTIR